MNNANRNMPHKGPKFLDTKVLIAAMSMAVTVGLWNLLSNDAVRAQKAADNATPPAPIPPGDARDLPALPTLVPLVSVSPAQIANNATGGAAQANLPAVTQLRSVTAPTQVIVQKLNPVFDQPVVAVAGGGGGGKAPSPVTSTKSSR